MKVSKINSSSKVKCPHCGQLRSKKGLKEHIANVHEIGCPYCAERVISQKLLQKHLEGNHKEKLITSFVCHMCKKVLKSEEGLFQHMRLNGHHLHSVEFPICLQCNKEFRTKAILLDHLNQSKHNLFHPPIRSDDIPCPLCDKKFNSSKSLSQHISGKHPQSQKEIIINKKGVVLFEKPSGKDRFRSFLKKIIPNSLPAKETIIMDESVGNDTSVKETLDELYDVRTLPKKLMGKSPLDVCLACKENIIGLVTKDLETVKRAQDMKIKPVYLLSERGKHRDIIRVSKQNYSIS